MELGDQATERERVAAELSRHKEESARLVNEQAAERERVAAEVSRRRARGWRRSGPSSASAFRRSCHGNTRSCSECGGIRQRTELAWQYAELLRLQVESSREQAESERLEAKLTGTIDALELQLNRVYSSNSWKITELLRKLSGLSRKARLSG
jgi:hypothetical protein